MSDNDNGEFAYVIAQFDTNPPLTGQRFYDRRLELAQSLASKRGRNFTGVPSEERDVYLDVAGEALLALDTRLAEVKQQVKDNLEDKDPNVTVLTP